TVQSKESDIGAVAWRELNPAPYKFKAVEPISPGTEEHRRRAIEEAGYNTFLLRSADVFIDLLTDSGTTAMSDRQWAHMTRGDEAHAGGRTFSGMERVIQELFGFRPRIRPHHGPGADNLLSTIPI